MDRKSILVIRGGAIGDFLLTLPAIKLLRTGFPDCRLEIVGYRHICEIARNRFYADETRSIEYAPMAGFFNPKTDLDPGLTEYFASFGQVVSYLFDPDGFFGGNLRRAGVRNLIVGDPRIEDHDHAARQLASPLEQLALFLDDPAAEVFPSVDDFARADEILFQYPRPWMAVHPGSGSERKNWPLSSWESLLLHVEKSEGPGTVFVVAGESDTPRVEQLRPRLSNRIVLLETLPLPVLSAVLARCGFFMGHDSGISHLAAATGVPCLLLFGPTDPGVWGPANPQVEILSSPTGRMDGIPVEMVVDRLEAVRWQELES